MGKRVNKVLVRRFERVKAALEKLDPKKQKRFFNPLPQVDEPKEISTYTRTATSPGFEFNPSGGYDKFKAFLRKKGYILLGSGSYSMVYGRDNSDKVIKIGRRPDEDGWQDYILWANERGFGGNLAPKLYSYKNYGEFYVAVMERLTGRSHRVKSDEDKVRVETSSVLYRLMQMSLEDGNSISAELADLLDSRWKSFYTAFNEQFGETSVDFHSGNVMARENGEIVITDPLASVDRVYTITRWKAGTSRPATIFILIMRNLRELI